jgi:hypothetical protein
MESRTTAKELKSEYETLNALIDSIIEDGRKAVEEWKIANESYMQITSTPLAFVFNTENIAKAEKEMAVVRESLTKIGLMLQLAIDRRTELSKRINQIRSEQTAAKSR